MLIKNIVITTSLVFMFFFDSSAIAETISIDAMLKELREMNGEYKWNDKAKGYIYSPGFEETMSKIKFDTKQIVNAIIDCVDDTTSSNSIIKGKKVAMGVVCYELLNTIIYNESATENWHGYLTPAATSNELKKAKYAWKKQLKRGIAYYSDLAKKKLKEYKLTTRPLECVSFEYSNVSEWNSHFLKVNFTVREVHNKQCGGDPHTAPAITFIGFDKYNQIWELDVIEAEYVRLK
ncbi:MAG: hypothetical protein D6B27_07205 [Gammaproteobacteria bacterium]|nr:MAG: hypothetical protein D6B27_07205 [Gammaproteobacteria bacterium]